MSAEKVLDLKGFETIAFKRFWAYNSCLIETVMKELYELTSGTSTI